MKLSEGLPFNLQRISVAVQAREHCFGAMGSVGFQPGLEDQF